MSSSTWEYEWSPEKGRYYFIDKVSGKSSWSRPVGCDVQLPAHPPREDESVKAPPYPTDLPVGWKAVLDRRPKVNRYFYYKVSKPTERTWYKPLPDLGPDPDQEEEEEGAARRVNSGNADKANQQRRFQMFKRPIQHLKAEKIATHKRKMIAELLEEGVWRANQDLVARSDHISVPFSRKVQYQEIQQALAKKMVKSFDQQPKVTFSETSLASAALLFVRQDRSRRACIVNCTTGEFPPIVHGLNMETELYCQVPNLLPSLTRTKPQQMTPLGPRSCVKGDLSSFSDLIYSPDCTLARGGMAEEFELHPEDKQATTPVLSSAAPLKNDDQLALDSQTEERLIQETLTSIFVTPVLRNPLCTTLILGAWGCEDHYRPEPTFVATKLAELLSGKMVENVRVGWLYNEVHFCFPEHIAGVSADSAAGEQEPDLEVFRRVFNQFKLNHNEL